MKKITRYSIALLSLFSISAQAEQLPFPSTQDLYAIDRYSGILKIAPNKDISVFLSIDQIESVIGKGRSSLSDNGIAFDTMGNMYFADYDNILKYTKTTSTLSILASESSIETAQGFAVGSNTTDVDAITVGSNGNLYVTDDKANSVLKINATSGNVSVHASKADFLTQTGINVDIEQGIATGDNGSIFVASQGSSSASTEIEDAIFKITANGMVSILVSNDQIADPDQFMTTDANGDLVVASDEGTTEQIFKVSVSDGTVSELISTQILEGLLLDASPDVDIRGGMAYDDQGNLYVGDSDEDHILRFDAALNGELWISKTDIMAVTGESNVNLGAGFAFSPAPVPVPAAAWLFGSGLMLLFAGQRKQSIQS